MALKTDRYFNSLDLKHNLIPDEAVKHSLPLIQDNKNIINIDLE